MSNPDTSIESREKEIREAFLAKARVTNETEAMRDSIRAALQHNPTYLKSATDSERELFRASLASHLRDCACNYSDPVSEVDHIRTMVRISQELSEMHKEVLINSRLRLGTVQKALNLYLKFLWCFDLNRAAPPHCPVDRIVLERVKIYAAWTQLDSVDTYRNWIGKLTEVASDEGFASLQHWELSLWNEKA